MAELNFTKRSVEARRPPTSGTDLYWDTEIAGLGLRVEASGSRRFYWSRRINKKLYWRTIGEAESITIDDARARATAWNKQADDWRTARFVGEPPWAAPPPMTLGEVVDAYRDDHIKVNAKKPEAAAKNIDWMMKGYAAPVSSRQLAQLTRSEIVSLQNDLREKHGPYASNRTLQLLKAAINWAVENGKWSGPNPVAGVKLGREKKRKRFLDGGELAALKGALDDPEINPDARDIIYLALFTAQRKSDVMSMAWKDIDMKRATWLIRDPKNREEFTVALASEALAILKERAENAGKAAAKSALPVSPYVFPSYGREGRIMDVKKSWAKVLTAAGIADFRFHDCRHTMASWAAMGGASLLVLGAAIGHKDVASTARYSHVGKERMDPVRATVESTAAAMSRAMRAKKPAQLAAAPPAKKRARRG